MQARDRLAAAIAGVPEAERSRVATVLLQRLMWLWFLQLSGRLDGDPRYLPRRLHAGTSTGDDPTACRFQFGVLAPILGPLASRHGLSLGDALVPWAAILVDGCLPASIAGMRIPDAAFSELFARFDELEWRLERPTGASSLIVTPDDLGHLTEQTHDRRRTGAYYTDRDVAEHITHATVVPALLDRLALHCPQVLVGDHSPTRLVARHPDRYIFPSLRHGDGLPLPPDVASGLCDPAARAALDRPAPPECALPVETWRDVIERRRHLAELRRSPHDGRVTDVTGLVAANLDLRRLALDLIDDSASPAVPLALIEAIREIRILDPTCGSGAFLVAALALLDELYRHCVDRLDVLGGSSGDLPGDARASTTTSHRTDATRATIVEQCLYGVDLSPEAIEVCRMRLALACLGTGDPAVEPATAPRLTETVQVGNALFPEQAAGSFDVVLGNPPYVEVSPHDRRDRGHPDGGGDCGNLAGYVFERALSLLCPGGRAGMILPLSLTCTDRAAGIQRLLREHSTVLSFYSGDRNPTELFRGVKMRLAIALVALDGGARLWTTRYQKWFGAARPHVFSTLAYHPAGELPYLPTIPKLGSPREARILGRLLTEPRTLGDVMSDAGCSGYYHNAPIHWVRAFTFVPFFSSSRDGDRVSEHYRRVAFASSETARAAIAALNSSLFYCWFVWMSNCRDLFDRDLRAFPLDLPGMASRNRAELASLCDALMDAYRSDGRVVETNYRTTGRVRYEQLDSKLHKRLIDRIDAVLARHFDLDADDLDFIRTYDLKFRMGKARIFGGSASAGSPVVARIP